MATLRLEFSFRILHFNVVIIFDVKCVSGVCCCVRAEKPFCL